MKTWDAVDLEWNNKANRNAKGKLQKSFQLSAGASYSLDKIILNGRVDTRFGGTYDYCDNSKIVHLPFELNFHLWPTYSLGAALLGIDFGLEYLSKKTQGDKELLDSGVRVGGGVWIERQFASCTIRAAVLFRAPDKFCGYKEDMVLTIPIAFNFSF